MGKSVTKQSLRLNLVAISSEPFPTFFLFLVPAWLTGLTHLGCKLDMFYRAKRPIASFEYILGETKWEKTKIKKAKYAKKAE